MDLDYAVLADEIVKLLDTTQSMTLATCSDNRVTARSMAIINDGLTIMFQTSGLSEKIQQITANPNVAFSIGNIQVEAVAQITKDPGIIESFVENYKVKYPRYYAAYSGMPDEVTVVCTPTRFAFYKYIDGEPCTDVLDVRETLAYRKVLS